MATKIIKNPVDTPLSLTDLLSFHDQAYPYFQPKWEKARQNERRWLGKSWTEAQEQEIRNQDRYPYSIPLVPSKLKIISATQKKTRTQFKIEASSDPRDEIKAELATLRVRDIERRSDFVNTEGDVYDSGLGILFGVTKIRLDYSQQLPQIIIEKKDYRDFVWDPNSKKYDINEDALWACDLERVQRFILEHMQGVDTEGLTEGNVGLSFEGREAITYYCNRNPNNKDFDLITIFNHYQKVIRTYYCVIFPDTEGFYQFSSQVVGKFRNKRAAEERLRELNIKYLAKGLPFEGTIEEKPELRLDRYKFAYNKILEYEETELEKFPHNVFFALRFEDQFVSFMEFMEGLQMIFDRYWMQIDYAIGKDIQKVYELFIDGLANIETPESAMNKLNKRGGVIFKNRSEKIIEEFAGKGVNAQFFQVAEIIISLIEDLMGGRSFQGLAEGTNESGISVREKKAQGLLIAYVFADNFSRYKKALGKNLLWWLQHFDTEEMTIKAHGAALTPEMLQILKDNGIYTENLQNDGGGYVKINSSDNEMTYLKDAEFELIVTEAQLSDFERQAKLAQLLAAEKIDPYLIQSPTFQTLKLENMDVDVTSRQKIIRERQEAQAAEAQAAQEERNMRKAEIISKIPVPDLNKKEEKKPKKEE